jgi:hypothetical protein
MVVLASSTSRLVCSEYLRYPMVSLEWALQVASVLNVENFNQNRLARLGAAQKVIGYRLKSIRALRITHTVYWYPYLEGTGTRPADEGGKSTTTTTTTTNPLTRQDDGRAKKRKKSGQTTLRAWRDRTCE